MSGNRKLKVFLCHSKDDKPKVRKLYRRLVADGFDAWLDEEKLMPGQEWDLEIRKTVRETDVVIACISKGSTTKSGYVQKEIRFALDIAEEKPEGAIYLIPARLEDCSVPDRLGRYQWVNLFEQNGYKKLKDSLELCMKNLDIRIDSNELFDWFTQDMLEIPIIGPISRGMPLPNPESGVTHIGGDKQNMVNIARNLLHIKDVNDLFALEVKGNSMIDAGINDGDIVIMKPANKARNGEMVAIWLPRENETTLKYYFEVKGGFTLKPANPTMKSVFIKKNEPLEIKGKVVMVIRKIVTEN
jgi:SOS-response transcriptional repressor LexA